jgi:4-diphosphocytidyl-2-C-methyl-D-erythritol kinase
LPRKFIKYHKFLEIDTKAYAKVNLHLEVLNIRPDGYHNILSLMSRIGIFDHLKLVSLDVYDVPGEDITVEIIPEKSYYYDVLETIPLKENLIYRAVVSYFRELKLSGYIAIAVQKYIPAGAGMGGGSSDAAGVFMMLNDYFKSNNQKCLAINQLMYLGSKLGADVPFCIHGGYALCEGVGDIITPVEGRINGCAVIAYGGIHINTGQAYRSLKRKSDPIPEKELEDKRRHIINALKSGSISSLKTYFRNDFETPVFEMHPPLRIIKQQVEDTGADFVTMTGSGSGIIGIFKDAEGARCAQTALSKKIKDVFVADFL